MSKGLTITSSAPACIARARRPGGTVDATVTITRADPLARIVRTDFLGLIVENLDDHEIRPEHFDHPRHRITGVRDDDVVPDDSEVGRQLTA